MVPDHACVPGLDRPVSVSEYATLKGVREAEVLAAIRALKIRSAFFRGQWYVEAPPNCEERLAQLRGERQPHDTREKATATPNADARLLNRPQTNTKTKEAIERDSETERLRVQFVKSHWRYDRLTAAQQQALLGTQKYAERPQPIDYGLSRYDLYTQVGRYPLDESLKCREEASHEWRWIFLVAFVCGLVLMVECSTCTLRVS